MRQILVVVLGTGLTALAGCGGGGDDSGGGGGGGGPVSTTPLVYVGSNSAAVITATNAGVLVANLAGNGSSSLSPSLSLARSAQFPDAGQLEVGRRLSRGVHRSIAPALHDGRGRLSLAIPVDRTEPCDTGSVRTVGTLNDQAIGTLAVTYNNCLLGNDTLNGSATLRIDAYDLALDLATDFTLSFARMVLRAPGLNVDVGGSFRTQTNVPANTETVTQNVVTFDNATGRMTRSENLVQVDRYSNVLSPSSYLEAINGRIYDSVHGFVDVATLVQLSFATLTQDFPDSGMFELTGAAGARIRVSGVSNSRVTLALDLDADSNFETTVTLGWSELSGPIGANLADSDGDGMHDGWETANGLNISDPGDAALDADGDGANNLMEYNAGTDPRSSASTPPIVGLSIISASSANAVVAGTTVLFQLTVTNASSSTANDVVVTNTIPPGVLVSGTATQGSCSGLQPVTCNIGNVNAFGTVTIFVSTSPQATGVHSNTATVTTTSIDSTMSDNTAVSTITVGESAGSIQAMIDVAVDGATIQVQPGIYVGSINFTNKNITLSGSDPVTTVIHGNGGIALRMGPNGIVRGFTITGSPVLAVETIGSGSLIARNLFIGNGRVIEGNNSSPTIDGNVFRNNGCGNASNQGLVQPFNNSAPVIVNNVFENNACFAILLGLPVGNTPQVLNNTFVGNFGAVKVDRRVSQTTQVYRNNLITLNATGLEAEFGTDAENPVWTNNLVFGNAVDYRVVADQTGVNGNISEDPLLVDQPGGNYRLQASSPAIDAGSATGAPAIDFDGMGRPQGAGFDIGAFERIP